jgi:CheY-like chemotaxis protein
MGYRKILVIDDEKDIQAMIRAVLTAQGDEVHSALDAVQGSRLARQPDLDAIILDINMPGGGGYTVYERLSTMETTRNIPVLLYTAVPEAEVRARIGAAPTIAYLGKPAQPEEIARALNRLLGSL